MKALVLENGFKQDIPSELIRYLDGHKIEWEWFDMRRRFWPENKDETFNFFKILPNNQLIICSTVFDGFQQLELMIALFHRLKDKQFTFKIMHPCLCDALLKFYEHYESMITPKEYDNDRNAKRSVAFKKAMNNKFLEVLQFHKIFWIKTYGLDEMQLSDLIDIKKGCYE